MTHKVDHNYCHQYARLGIKKIIIIAYVVIIIITIMLAWVNITNFKIMYIELG